MGGCSGKCTVCAISSWQLQSVRYHRPSRHGQTPDSVQLKICLSHKRHFASNTDVGFYCVNIMTTSFSSPERIV